jgi:uncharacterized ion transporter superfamily protein YfcC
MKTLKITAIAVMLLGSIHLAATPFIFSFFNGKPIHDLSSIYMFVIVGISILFTGWLQYFIISRLTEHKGYRSILVVSVIFITIVGVGAVAGMRDNPFAYISLVIACIELISLRMHKTS